MDFFGDIFIREDQVGWGLFENFKGFKNAGIDGRGMGLCISCLLEATHGMMDPCEKFFLDVEMGGESSGATHEGSAGVREIMLHGLFEGICIAFEFGKIGFIEDGGSWPIEGLEMAGEGQVKIDGKDFCIF